MGSNMRVIITALLANIGGLLFGFQLAWSASIADEMVNNENYRFEVSSTAFGWVVGFLSLGGVFGPLLGGFSRDILGTNLTKIIFCIPHILGQFMIMFAVNLSMLLIGRFLNGVSVAVFSVLCPLYVGEISPNKIRGALVSCFQINLNFGVLIIFIMGFYSNMMTINIVCTVVPMLYGIIFFFLPESPAVLVSKNRDRQAEEVLLKLRGNSFDYKSEIAALKVQNQTKIESEKSVKEILSDRATFNAMILILCLFFFFQMSGINVVLFYATTIFAAAGVDIDPGVSSIIIAIIALIASFLATAFVDKFGRKILLTSSFASCFLGLVGIGTFFVLQDFGINTANIEWLPLASLGVFNFFFNFGIAPVTYTLLAEILKDEAKSIVAPMGLMMNFFLSFVLGFTFPFMIESIGIGFTFYFFASVTFVGTIFVIVKVFETKGKSFEEIIKMLE